jgi:hypothetical protein
MIRFMINEGVTDRRDRGLQKPWGTGRHAIVLNEPEQLRGPLSPHHARMANKEAGMSNASVFAGIDVSKVQLDLALRPGEGCSFGEITPPHRDAFTFRGYDRRSEVSAEAEPGWKAGNDESSMSQVMSQPRVRKDCRHPEPIADGAEGEKSAAGRVCLVYLVGYVCLVGQNGKPKKPDEPARSSRYLWLSRRSAVRFVLNRARFGGRCDTPYIEEDGDQHVAQDVYA